MTFSQRIGISPRTALQLDAMTPELRNGRWNALDGISYWAGRGTRNATDQLANGIWCEVLKEPKDQLDQHLLSWSIQQIRAEFFKRPWNTVYEIIEFTASFLHGLRPAANPFVEECNRVL